MELDELVEEFVVESREHLDSIEDEFLQLEGQQDNPDYDLIAKVFRAIHSVKGAAGFFGLYNINNLAHAMETLLSMMRDGAIMPESVYIDALLVGVDFLNKMLDDIQNSNEIDIAAPLDKLNNLIKGTSPEVEEEMETQVTISNSDAEPPFSFEVDLFTLKQMHKPGHFLYSLKFDLNKLNREKGTNPLSLLSELTSLGEVIDGQLTISADDLDMDFDDIPLYYELLYTTVIDESLIAHAVGLEEEDIEHLDPDIFTHIKPDHSSADKDGGGASNVDEIITEPETAADIDFSDNLENYTPDDDHIALDDLTEFAVQPREPMELQEQAPPATTAVSKVETGVKKSSEQSSSIRIKVDILEELMRLAGELVLIRNQQLLVSESTVPEMKSITQRLDIVTSELQENIMRTRMQPIGNVFNKVPRIIRDLSKKLNKLINLEMSGVEVELDKTILEALADPITHMIRNCCDHAIELPSDRQKSGKPREGSVHLKAYHESGHIVIEIEDDGRGIDADRVRAKALSNGLRSESELAAMTVKEIQELVMLPGFSTAAQVSDVSGRGVGMDVVRASIEKLGGTLHFESVFGQGTKFLMRLPLTLAIIPCLVIRVNGQRYAIPQVNLEELVCLYDEQVVDMIETTGDKEVYRLRNILLPMIRLSEVLTRNEPFSQNIRSEITQYFAGERKKLKEQYEVAKESGDREAYKALTQSLNFAVVRVAGKRFGLILDEVIGTEEVVVKPMHSKLKGLHCYSGATVMGDGEVALILNISGIADYTGVTAGISYDDNSSEEEVDNVESETQNVLLFKSGPSEQFAVPLPLIRRIEKISATDIQEIGNQEFATIEGVSTRILRLDDMLDVTKSERNVDELFVLLPKHTQKPYGVLFISLLDVMHVSLSLDTSSYPVAGVLGTSIINDVMTLFLDVYKLIERHAKLDLEHMDVPEVDDRVKPRILLVEDTPFFLKMVKGYLETEGYEVETATNGQEGLSKFGSNDYDVVVADLEMPIMDGFEMMNLIRKQGSGIPALALSSLSSRKDIEKAKHSGFDKYNLKVNLERLAFNVSSLIGLRVK